MKRVSRATALLSFGALLLGAVPALAQQISQAGWQQIQAVIDDKLARTPVQRKLSSRLIYAERMAAGRDAAPGVPSLRRSVAVDARGLTLVDIDATVTNSLLALIAARGGEVVNAHPQFDAMRARVALSELEAIAASPDVRSIRPADRAITRMLNTSEGDITHAADKARALFGFDGTGVTVGVISDGVDQRVAVTATGDLPPECPGGPPCVEYLAGELGSGSEGTAMLEIVTDLVPGADLKFATALGGQAAFAQNILDLRTEGCDVIVDDIFYFAEPVFQDGVIAQAINTVHDDGAIYFSAAGNAGNLNDGTSGVWEGDFVGIAAPPAVGAFTAHDFGGSTNFNTITDDPPFGISLFWSDATGASGNDYDLLLMDPTLTTIFDSSTTTQDGNDDPFEFIDSGAFNDTGNALVIIQFSGADRYLHLNTIRGELLAATDGQTAGHSAAEKAVGVGAVSVVTTGCPNCSRFKGGGLNPVETFSSDGPRQIFYDDTGTAITPGNFLAGGGQVLQKPDLAAADGVMTATAGFNPFFGTSAAAPHAAAIAAWLIDRDESLRDDPTGILNLMKFLALDIEAPGADRDSGAGVVVMPVPVPVLGGVGGALLVIALALVGVRRSPCG